MEAIETYEHAGSTIEIHYSEHGDSPREWCNLGRMVHWHRNYEIGDERISPEDTGVDSIEGLTEWAKREHGATVVLPVYLYDHSGITISTSPFSCPWDSGQVGIIFDTPEGRAECGTPPELIEEVLRGEVETFDQYLRGEVYGYIVEVDGEVLDACWDFYGFDDCKAEAESVAEREAEAYKALASYEAAH